MELFLIEQVAGQSDGIDAAQVDSVVDLSEIVVVPRADRAVRGLAALRSRVITVIDSGIALGLAPMPDGAKRAVITRIDGHAYAVLVDQVDDVARFRRTPVTPGLALERGWAAAATGMIERDGEPMLVVDLSALVPRLAVAA